MRKYWLFLKASEGFYWGDRVSKSVSLEAANKVYFGSSLQSADKKTELYI